MHEDDTNPQIEHSEGEHLGCTVVAIYAGASGAGLVMLAVISILVDWQLGLLALAAIVSVAAVLWSLLHLSRLRG